MITLITDTLAGETPYPESAFMNPLTVTDLEGNAIVSIAAPDGRWTHEALALTVNKLSHITNTGLFRIRVKSSNLRTISLTVSVPKAVEESPYPAYTVRSA